MCRTCSPQASGAFPVFDSVAAMRPLSAVGARIAFGGLNRKSYNDLEGRHRDESFGFGTCSRDSRRRRRLVRGDENSVRAGFRVVASGRGAAVFPPADLDAHPWVETASEALALGVEIGAERVDHADGLTLAPGTEGATAFLRMLGSELDVLIAPVRVFAALELLGGKA